MQIPREVHKTAEQVATLLTTQHAQHPEFFPLLDEILRERRLMIAADQRGIHGTFLQVRPIN